MGGWQFRRSNQEFSTRERVKRAICAATIQSRACPSWVKNRPEAANVRCPLFPQQRTFIRATVRSALCQEATSNASLELKEAAN
jgi:hypothetical protein